MKTRLLYIALQSLSQWEAALQLSSQWRHNECDGVSNHWRLIVYSTLFRALIKETVKAPRHWPLYGEFTGAREFPGQTDSNSENVSTW